MPFSVRRRTGRARGSPRRGRLTVFSGSLGLVFSARSPPRRPPRSPARAVRRRACARVTRSARRRDVHRQPRPTHAGPTGRPSPNPGGVTEKEGERREEPTGGGGRAGRPARAPPNRASQRSALRGTKATDACDCPSRGKRERFRLMAKRPSDRRSPGRNPGPQGAFEVSMINVSCNSH